MPAAESPSCILISSCVNQTQGRKFQSIWIIRLINFTIKCIGATKTFVIVIVEFEFVHLNYGSKVPSVGKTWIYLLEKYMRLYHVCQERTFDGYDDDRYDLIVFDGQTKRLDKNFGHRRTGKSSGKLF